MNGRQYSKQSLEEMANRQPKSLWAELTSTKCFNVTSLRVHSQTLSVAPLTIPCQLRKYYFQVIYKYLILAPVKEADIQCSCFILESRLFLLSHQEYLGCIHSYVCSLMPKQTFTCFLVSINIYIYICLSHLWFLSKNRKNK